MTILSILLAITANFLALIAISWKIVIFVHSEHKRIENEAAEQRAEIVRNLEELDKYVSTQVADFVKANNIICDRIDKVEKDIASFNNSVEELKLKGNTNARRSEFFTPDDKPLNVVEY